MTDNKEEAERFREKIANDWWKYRSKSI